MFTVGSKKYFARSVSFGRSYLNLKAGSSFSIIFGSNRFARTFVSSRSFFEGGATSAQSPSIAGLWFPSTRVSRACTSRHTGDETQTALRSEEHTSELQ